MRLAVRLAEQAAPRWLEARAFRAWCRPQKRASRWGALAESSRRFTFSGSEELAAWEWNAVGPRPTALLVHGWSGNAGQMSSFVEPLVARGFHVVAVDLPAHGESHGDFTTLVSMADAVVSLGRRLFPEVIIAHSLGATATTLALDAGLSPRRVALLAPPAQMPPYLRHFAEQVGLSATLQARLLARIEALTQRKVDELELARLAPDLGRVEALVVHDEGDDEVPLSAAQDVVQQWPGARLVVTHGLGHHGIRRDAAVVGEVVRFVGGEVAASPRRAA
ncbi:MAG: alpha/beta fold hydrolase [Myxococcota bacterium]